jgi:hypothetical protein
LRVTLAIDLSVPVVHLDAIYWNLGWSPSEVEPLHEKLAGGHWHVHPAFGRADDVEAGKPAKLGHDMTSNRIVFGRPPGVLLQARDAVRFAARAVSALRARWLMGCNTGGAVGHHQIRIF